MPYYTGGLPGPVLHRLHEAVEAMWVIQEVAKRKPRRAEQIVSRMNRIASERLTADAPILAPWFASSAPGQGAAYLLLDSPAADRGWLAKWAPQHEPTLWRALRTGHRIYEERTDHCKGVRYHAGIPDLEIPKDMGAALYLAGSRYTVGWSGSNDNNEGWYELEEQVKADLERHWADPIERVRIQRDALVLAEEGRRADVDIGPYVRGWDLHHSTGGPPLDIPDVDFVALLGPRLHQPARLGLPRAPLVPNDTAMRLEEALEACARVQSSNALPSGAAAPMAQQAAWLDLINQNLATDEQALVRHVQSPRGAETAAVLFAALDDAALLVRAEAKVPDLMRAVRTAAGRHVPESEYREKERPDFPRSRLPLDRPSHAEALDYFHLDPLNVATSDYWQALARRYDADGSDVTATLRTRLHSSVLDETFSVLLHQASIDAFKEYTREYGIEGQYAGDDTIPFERPGLGLT